MIELGEPDIMTDESTRKPNHGGIVAALLLLLVFYVLSIGPAMKMSIKYRLRFSTLRQIYFPVFWIHNHTALEKPLEQYFDLWVP